MSLPQSKSIHPTVAFFRTNRNVCKKYFRKIRHKLFNALLPFSTNHEIMARGYQVLNDVKEGEIGGGPNAKNYQHQHWF